MASTSSATSEPTSEPTTPAPRPASWANRPPFNPEIFLNMNIVLNVYRSQDPCIREVVSLRDIVEEGLISWDKLVEILSVKVSGVRVFDPEEDMMMFDSTLFVHNRRQFLAALQWTSNKKTAVNIFLPIIHGSDKEAREKAWGIK